MGSLWHSYGSSIIFLWCFYGITMGFLREWILMGFLCGSYEIPCYFYYLSMGFLWDSNGISMICLWYFLGDYYGITIGLYNQWEVNWNQLKVNWNHLKVGGCEPLAVSKRRCLPHPGRPPFASSEGVRRRRGSKAIATAQFLLCIGPASSQNGHPPAASLQTFLQDRSLPLPPASNCWAKTAFPTSASLDHPKLSGLALHSIKVNWNQLNVNWNQLKVNWLKSIESKLNINWHQLNINWNQLKVNWNQLKVNWNQTKSIHKILFRPRSLKKHTLNRASELLWGGSPLH